MKRLNVSLTLGTILAFAGMTCVAETNYYLVPEGTEGNTPTSPYNSWATAANALSDITGLLQTGSARSVINIKPGTYYPTNVASIATAPSGSQRSNTIIRSCDPLTGEIDPENTIFDGSKMPINDGTQSRILKTGTYNPGIQIKGLTFRNMAAGGAVYFGAGNSTVGIYSCNFENNVVSNGNGGAVYSYYNTTRISNCTFRCNKAVSANGDIFGGAVYVQGGGGVVSDCQFASNEVIVASSKSGAGGAMAMGGDEFNSKAVIERCAFLDNLSHGGTGLGGHVNIEGKASATYRLTDCVFGGMVGGNYGSVLRMHGAATAEVTKCRFGAFSAPYGSGYGHIQASGSITNTISDCVISNFVGISIFCYDAKSTTVRNTLFCQSGSSLNNSALWVWGGAAACENCTITGVASGHKFQDNSGESMTYVNCILPSRTNCGNDKTTLENCGVLTECAAYPFMSTAKGDYRLNAAATAFIDAGKVLDWHAGANDLGGRKRVVGTAVDIGCYERQTNDPELYYYRAVATEAEKTGRWADASVGIQAAIDAAPSGSYVGIRSGTWNIDKTITVYGKSLTIRGLKADSDEIDRDGTILDGGNARRIMQITNRSEPIFNNLATEGIGSVVGAVVVEGLTFRNGDATKGTHNVDDGTTSAQGGLVRDEDGNKVDNNGGGLWMRATASGDIPYSLARNCRFVNNTANNGGGMYLAWGGAAEDCLFETNSATAGCGGGLCGYDQNAGAIANPWSVAGKSNPLALRCRFIGNESSKNGGGFGDGAGWCYWRIFAFDSYFDSNRSGSGGGNFAGGAGSWVAGCTFRNGRCPQGDVSANVQINSSAVISNCVICGGRALDGGHTHNVGIGTYDYSAGCTTPGTCQIVDSVISNASWGVRVHGSLLARNSLFDGLTELLLDYSPKSGAAAGSVRFENCTLVNMNLKTYSDASRAFRATATNTIFNCSLTNFGKYDETHFTTLTAGNCCFGTMPGGAGYDIDQATSFAGSPNFKNVAAGDYSLKRASRCRDAGVILPWMPSHVDLAGNPRIVKNGFTLDEDPGALPDMGCYEYQLPAKGFLLLVK